MELDIIGTLGRVCVIFLRRALRGAGEVGCCGGGRNRIAVPTLGHKLHNSYFGWHR